MEIVGILDGVGYSRHGYLAQAWSTLSCSFRHWRFSNHKFAFFTFLFCSGVEKLEIIEFSGQTNVQTRTFSYILSKSLQFVSPTSFTAASL